MYEAYQAGRQILDTVTMTAVVHIVGLLGHLNGLKYCHRQHN